MGLEIVEELKLEITRDCNLECKHCYRGEKEDKYMSLDTIDAAFRDVKSIWILSLVGGETFLASEQIKRVYENIVKNNIEVGILNINTNCTVENDEIVETLAKLSKVVEHLYVWGSLDSFRFMQYEEKNLIQQVNNNVALLDEKGYLKIKDSDIKYKKIYTVGRAEKLTQEDIDEANRRRIDFLQYLLVDESEYYPSRSLNISPSCTDNTIFRTVYITVDGNLCSVTPTVHTYKQEDMMIENNIKDFANLKEAIDSIDKKAAANKIYKIFKR